MYCQSWRKMSEREHSSIYQEEDFATLFHNSFCRGSLLHWSVLESVISSLIPTFFGVPSWVRMMQNSPSIPQLKRGRRLGEEVFLYCFCPVSCLPFYWHCQHSSMLVWLFLVCLQCRSLSNQYWNENISPFHAECCTTLRESLGGSGTNFLIFCVWSSIMYYYYSNLSIALTREEGTFHTNFIALCCGEKCSSFLLISENVIHPSNCQTLPTRQIDRFCSNEFLQSWINPFKKR